ncbi:unnamed protein product [Ambrosiozyma monospora]|uniref:Unnamed protein product n=1 Tax=Ambrosiozyma monospora TaxID=43982 RepID=A0A9W6YUH8_AMBMO|nr:unnamed protein product [Ambrosiozyma monospora]
MLLDEVVCLQLYRVTLENVIVNAGTTTTSSLSASTTINSSYYKPTSTYSLNIPLKSIPWMNMISSNVISQGANTIGAANVPSSSSSSSSSNFNSIAIKFVLENAYIKGVRNLIARYHDNRYEVELKFVPPPETKPEHYPVYATYAPQPVPSSPASKYLHLPVSYDSDISTCQF